MKKVFGFLDWLHLRKKDENQEEKKEIDIDERIQHVFDLMDEVFEEPHYIRVLHFESSANILLTIREYITGNKNNMDKIDAPYYEKVKELRSELNWLRTMMVRHNTMLITRADGKGTLDDVFKLYVTSDKSRIWIIDAPERRVQYLSNADKTEVITATKLCNAVMNNTKIAIDAEANFFAFCSKHFNFKPEYVNMRMIDNFIDIIDKVENKSHLLYEFEGIVQTMKEYYMYTSFYYGHYSDIDGKLTTSMCDKDFCYRLVCQLQNTNTEV